MLSGFLSIFFCFFLYSVLKCLHDVIRGKNFLLKQLGVGAFLGYAPVKMSHLQENNYGFCFTYRHPTLV